MIQALWSHTLTVPLEETSVILPEVCKQSIYISMKSTTTYSLTSLHSGAKEADILLFPACRV
jgi:hypothetical protein